MEILSEPDYTEEEVIDVDINFIGGEPLRVTLKPAEGDLILDEKDYIRISVPRIGVTATAERRNITHSDIKRHIIRKLTKKPEPTTQASSRSQTDQGWRPSPLSVGPVGRLDRDEDES
jgi:hypothetical protein